MICALREIKAKYMGIGKKMIISTGEGVMIKEGFTDVVIFNSLRENWGAFQTEIRHGCTKEHDTFGQQHEVSSGWNPFCKEEKAGQLVW